MDKSATPDTPEKVEKKDVGLEYINQASVQNVAGIQIPVLNSASIEIPDTKFGCSMIFVGSTRSGKTTLMNYLFKRHFESYISVLMSNSLNSDAYKYLKKQCVTSDWYHPEILKDMYKINHSTKNNYQFMVVIDDVPDKRNDAEIKRMLTIYRNSRISCMFCAQGLTMLDKLARGNINFVFLGRMNSSEEVERNIKSYLQGHFPTNLKMSEKIKLYRQMTENHQWLVLDQINNHFFMTKLTETQLIGV
jgi:hypothetical protein